MKGVVFTEFLEMVEDKFSPELADRIVNACDLPSGGVYTAVGTYHHDEIVQLVVKLSEETKVAVPDLLRVFGQHMFGRFHAGYPQFFAGITDALTFLEGVEGYIHVEVRKLYPDAELPSFKYERPSPDRMVMTYSSARPFGPLAEGLISACIDHYGGGIEVSSSDVSGGHGTSVRFELTRKTA